MSLKPQREELPDPTIGAPHREYRYLVRVGAVGLWVHCPVCLSTNAGRSPSNRPQYSGGWVRVKLPKQSARWDKKLARFIGVTVDEDMIAPCWCELGQKLADFHGLTQWHNLNDKTVAFDTYPADEVIYDKQRSHAPAPALESIAKGFTDYHAQLNRGAEMLRAGDITDEKFAEGVVELNARYLKWPEQRRTLDEIKSTPVYLAQYSP